MPGAANDIRNLGVRCGSFFAARRKILSVRFSKIRHHPPPPVVSESRRPYSSGPGVGSAQVRATQPYIGQYKDNNSLTEMKVSTQFERGPMSITEDQTGAGSVIVRAGENRSGESCYES